MFRLLRYFSIISLIAFIAVAVILGELYYQTAVNDLTKMGENHNVVLTQAFANSLGSLFEPLLKTPPNQNPAELRADPQTTRLYQAVLAQMQGTTVVKIKVYTLDGLTVFSTQASQTGENKGSNAGFQSARSGTPISELTHRDTFSAFEQTVENIDVLSSYVPFMRAGKVEGVFEVYTDVTPLLNRIGETQRNTTLAMLTIFGALYVILFLLMRRADVIIRRQYGEIKQAHEQATQAQEAADKLLLNILPAPIVAQLKDNPGTIADTYQDVTVLFVDIVDLTRLTAHDDPVEIVNLLNRIFTDLDGLAQKYGLEKIKTVGDAYMVAGGIPIPRPDHAEAVANMALDILDVMRAYTWHGEPVFVRIGINTGPVVAGVIGRQKFIYDLWGDAVNTASRMESNSIPGVIQVTHSTYEKLRSSFRFEKRGPIYVKGKGKMETYLLQERISYPPPEEL